MIELNPRKENFNLLSLYFFHQLKRIDVSITRMNDNRFEQFGCDFQLTFEGTILIVHCTFISMHNKLIDESNGDRHTLDRNLNRFHREQRFSDVEDIVQHHRSLFLSMQNSNVDGSHMHHRRVHHPNISNTNSSSCLPKIVRRSKSNRRIGFCCFYLLGVVLVARRLE